MQISFICSHPGSIESFDRFNELLQKHQLSSALYTTASLSKKLSANFEIFYSDEKTALSQLGGPEENALAEQVAKTCALSQCVFVDIGSSFSNKLLEVLAKKYPSVKRVVFYDNPERYVPGEYSKNAAKACALADAVFFANKLLSQGEIYKAPSKPIDLSGKTRIGVGYSSLPKKLKLLQELREKEGKKIREDFLNRQGIVDRDQEIYVYVGGANSVYYQQAFPHLLKILKEAELPEQPIFLLQQHPRAPQEGNIDRNLLEESKDNLKVPFLLSDLSFDQVMLLADRFFYYQTSANSLGALLMPTFQIGHERNEDLLVREGFCKSVISVQDLQEPWDYKSIDPQKLYEKLGIAEDWEEAFSKELQNLFSLQN